MKHNPRQETGPGVRKKRIKTWRRIVSILCVIVVFCTTYAMVLPAITLEKPACCGMEEHVHTDACYEERPVLTCAMEETEGHTHTDACCETVERLVCPLEEDENHVHGPECYETERVLICGQDECAPHIHTVGCYGTERVPICELPEHVHTDACFEAEPVPEASEEDLPDEETASAGDPTADVEGEADWNAMIARLPLTGNRREDVRIIAASQVGYTESVRNYVIDPDTGERRGYTRFGAWYGMPYEDWCAMFAIFCLHYAGVTKDQIPRSAACDRWSALLISQGQYRRPGGTNEACEPVPGDLIFFRSAPGAAEPDHVGIVEAYDAESCTVCTIEGNCDDSVSRMRYDSDDPRIDGYCPMSAQDETPEESCEAVGESRTDLPPSLKNAPMRLMAEPARAAGQSGGSVNDLITAAVITVDGQQITGPDWGTLVKGQTYKLTLTFRENQSHQFADDGGWMEYDLPPELQVMNVSGKFDQNLGYFGVLRNNDFEISGGKLRFRWNTADTEKFEILQAADSATVAFNMDIRFDGEVRTVHFGAGLDKTVNLDNPHDAEVRKSGYYDPNDQKIHYRLEVSSRGASENVRLTDTISGSALTLDSDSIRVKNKNGQTVPSGSWGNWSYNPKGFTLNLPDMSDGDKYIVEYTASVHLDQLGHSGQTTYSETGNTVRVATKEDNNPGNNTGTNYLYNIQSSDLTKHAGAPGEVYTENGQKYRDITWTVHANPQRLTKVGTITDSIDANSCGVMDFTGSGVTVRVNGGQARSISWGSNGLTRSPDGKSWSYTPPASDGNAEYEITYKTRVKVGENTVEVTNTVTDAHNRTVEGQFVPGEGGSGGGDEPEERLDVYKTAATVTDEYVVWTIRVPVPREGFDSLVVTEQLPHLDCAEGCYTDPLDKTFGTNGFQISGLMNGERFTVQENIGSYWVGGNKMENDPWGGSTTETITFFKNRNQQGLNAGSENRELVIKLRTLNNPDWMRFAQGSGNEYAKTHQNRVGIAADGKTGSTEAAATPLKAKITKSSRTDPILEPQTVKLSDGREYTAYPYQITVEGVQKEPVEIFDTFDTSIFEVLELSDLASDYNNSNSQLINTPALNPQRITPCEGPWGGQPSEVFARVTDREDGAMFTMTDLPKKVDPRTGEQTVYYGFYRMTCYLVLKDEDALKRQAMLNGGTVTFRNTAEYKDSASEADVDYTYKVISKDAQNGTDDEGNETNCIQHFTIGVNPDRLRLNGGNEMELTDTSSPSLSIIYDSIRITTEPASRRDEVTWDFNDRTGVFRVPDETKLIIEYDANVLGEGYVQFRNDAVLDGKYTDYADDTIMMSAAGGGSAEVVAIRLMKYASGHMEQGTLAGAKFRLLDSDQQPIEIGGQPVVFETDDGGPILIWLRQNLDGMTLHKNTIYYLEEIEAPPGYARDYTRIPFVISDDTDFEAPEGVSRYYIGGTMGVRNEPAANRTALILVKRFAGNETLREEQKGRIGFRITGPEGCDLTVSYQDFDEDGTFTLPDLIPGDYTVYETGALEAAEGTDCGVVTTCTVDEGEEQTVVDYAADGAQVTLLEDRTSTVVFTNTYSTHSYDFTKVDSRTDQPLEGAVFTVFRAADGRPVATYTSAVDGRFRVKWTDQADGSRLYREGELYYIAETQAPEAYNLPQDPPKYYFFFGQEPPDAPDGAVDLSTDDGEATVPNSADVCLTVRKRWVNALGEPTGSAPWGVDSLRFRIYRTERIVEHGQTPGDWEVTREATCTEAGERVKRCLVCREILETEVIPAPGHDMGPWEIVTEPTTTQTGLKRRSCARCGRAETEVIPVHTHSPGDWVTTQEPTCTQTGTRVRYCTGCGVVVASETRPALGHAYSAQVTAPTCTEAGYTAHTCSRCGDAFNDTPVAALGHDFRNHCCTRCGVEDPDDPPAATATATVTLAAPASWNTEKTESSEIAVNRTYRFVCTMKDWQDVSISRLTVNGAQVAVTKETVGSNPWHYLITSDPFAVTGDITVFARLDGVPDAVFSCELVPAGASGARSAPSDAGRKSAALRLPSAKAPQPEAAAPANAPTRPQAAPAEMTPEALQVFLEERGAVPYGDEIILTDAEGWTRTISDLPRRQGYTEYTYYVVELDPEGNGYHLVGYDGEGTEQITAINQTRPTGFELPRTGGPGTARHTIAGLSLLSAAFVIAYTKLRRRRPRSGEGGPDG